MSAPAPSHKTSALNKNFQIKPTHPEQWCPALVLVRILFPPPPKAEAAPTTGCGRITAASSGGVTWNNPVTLREGQLTNPDQRSYQLVNVPDYMVGGTYVGSRTWPQGSDWYWTITYTPPLKVYVILTASR